MLNIFKYENKFLFDKQEYNSINRNAVSHYGDFLRFVFKEYQELSVSKKEYTLNEIKQAINYTNKDHKKAFLDKAKDFVEYDKKSKIVTIDFEKAKSEIENVLKIEL